MTNHCHLIVQQTPSPHARVEVDRGVFIQIPASYAYSDPVFRVTSLDGRQLRSVSWPSNQVPVEFWAQLSATVEAVTSREFDVEAFLNSYTRLVELAATHSNLRGAVCLFEPQWMLCHLGLVPIDHPLEPLRADEVSDSDARTAVLKKEWVNEPSFRAAIAAVDNGMHG